MAALAGLGATATWSKRNTAPKGSRGTGAAGGVGGWRWLRGGVDD